VTAGRASTATEGVSLDGRTFTYRAAGGTPLAAGDVVVLFPSDSVRLIGQIFEQTSATRPDACAEGSGSLIGALSPDGVLQRSGRFPFASANVEAASVEDLEALQRASGADVPIGTWRVGGVQVPARLRGRGFNRHTFLCGQSGSGKTFALGVILEQMLLATDLQTVILDPNADFVRLGDTRPDVPDDVAKRLKRSEVRVLRPSAAGGELLRLRFVTLPRQAQAAILRLDPLADRDEYNTFLQVTANIRWGDIGELIAALRAGGPEERALAQRIENLGLPQWEVWAKDLASAAEVVTGGARVTVMDLGGFADPLEPVAVSLDVIESLWAQRESRTPTLVVIDEAHNLCAAEPTSSIQAALTQRLIQIAAEGRKYGLWLLLSTQRPSKIHPQVLSQCDNLALMRMNSPGDLAELAMVFGFAPPAMLRSAQFFAQGEALLAGGFAPTPMLVRMGVRLTFEGGSDVPVPMYGANPAGVDT
jgi:uncharacterized protein